MLKVLLRIPDQDIYIIIKTPPEQYSTSKFKTKKITEKIKPLSEFEKYYHSF